MKWYVNTLEEIVIQVGKVLVGSSSRVACGALGAAATVVNNTGNFFIDTRYITLLKKLKLFLFPGLRRVRSPSRVLLLYTIFGRMPGFEPELLRPQPGCGTQNTHPLKKILNQTPTPAKISCL